MACPGWMSTKQTATSWPRAGEGVPNEEAEKGLGHSRAEIALLGSVLDSCLSSPPTRYRQGTRPEQDYSYSWHRHLSGRLVQVPLWNNTILCRCDPTRLWNHSLAVAGQQRIPSDGRAVPILRASSMGVVVPIYRLALSKAAAECWPLSH
jgi:hypothetical protein